MALIYGSDYDHVDLQNNLLGGDYTRHMLKDAQARQSVSALISAMADNGLAMPITDGWVDKYRVQNPGAGNQIADPVGPIEGWRYIKIPCTAGQKFIVNAHTSISSGATTFRTWVFADANNVCTRYAPRDGTESVSVNELLVAQEGEAFLYINQTVSFGGVCYTGEYLSDRMDALAEQVSEAIAGVQSDADDALDLAQKAVRYDAAQTLTDAQAAQARTNIGAASLDDVSVLASTMADNGLAVPITDGWVDKYRMSTPSAGAQFTDPGGPIEGWRYIKIPCTAGQKFIVNAHTSISSGATTFRTWVFADANNVCTRYAPRDGTESVSVNELLVAQEGEAFLYINQTVSFGGVCYTGESVTSQMENLAAQVDAKIADVNDTIIANGLAVPIESGWVENYRMGRVDVGSQFGDPGGPITGWRYIKIPCTPGQKFIINAHSTSVNFRTWAFADANNVCTRYADRTGTEVISVNEALTAETGEAFLYINQDSQGGTCYRGVYISDQLEALSEHVDDSIGEITEEFADTLNGTITLQHGGISTTYPDGGGSNQKRVYTRDIIDADGYMLVEADEGCTCWIFGYDENGALIGTTSERQLIGPARYVKSPGSRFRLVLAIASSTAGETYQDITDAMFPVVLQKFRVYKPQRTLALCQSADAVPAEWTSASIFQTVGVLGDSWASGSMHHVDNPDEATVNMALSWPQIMARQCGMDVTNYTHGGYDAKMWLADTEIGLAKLLSDPVKQLYMIDFGINDYMHSRPTYDGDYPITIGTIDDIKEDYAQNPDTFFGCYGRIIGNILDHAEANGKTTNIILMSVPRYTERGMDANIQQIAEHFSLPYMYLPDDLFFVSQFFVDQVWGGHLLCYGYGGMAAAIQRLLVKCIMEHMDYFGPYYGV